MDLAGGITLLQAAGLAQRCLVTVMVENPPRDRFVQPAKPVRRAVMHHQFFVEGFESKLLVDSLPIIRILHTCRKAVVNDRLPFQKFSRVF